MVAKMLRWLSLKLLTIAVRLDGHANDKVQIVGDALSISIQAGFDPSQPGRVFMPACKWFQPFPGGIQ